MKIIYNQFDLEKKNGKIIVLSHIARLILKLLKFLMHFFNQSVYRTS